MRDLDLTCSVKQFSKGRDHKSRGSLGTITLRVEPFTAKANVQDSCVGRRIGNGPIDGCSFRIEYRRNTHGERPAAIER
jgi:hypothetical protein